MSERTTTYRERFAPIIDKIAENVVVHERDRTLPLEEVRWLSEAGFGALRIPVEEGGGGARLTDLFAVLLDLATADSNQPQIWRNHIAFVDDRLQAEPAEQNAHWRTVVAGGAVIGAAWSERGAQSFTTSSTTLTDDAGRRLLNGRKYYSTGSNVADWISVLATTGDEPRIAVVDARDPGVTVQDDWAGFGQRTTGSGTSSYVDVPVPDVALFAFTQRASYQEALYQLVHVTTLAGIARAAQRDVVAHLQARTRAYPHGLADVPRQDAQLQAVVGRVAALASAAEASVQRGAAALDAAAELELAGVDGVDVALAVHEAAVAIYEAQLTVSDNALDATSTIFDALGSSALDVPLYLDRHWRNARTITSHNPRVYKERIVGDWYLNGTAPHVFDPKPRQETDSE